MKILGIHKLHTKSRNESFIASLILIFNGAITIINTFFSNHSPLPDHLLRPIYNHLALLASMKAFKDVGFSSSKARLSDKSAPL